MRVLADENFPGQLVEGLRSGGYDVLWARLDCAGWPDTKLLDFAESDARLMLTLDKDFWQIAIQRRVPLQRSGVVLFRVHPATVGKLAPLVNALLAADREWAGYIRIVSAAGIQMVAAGGATAGR